MLLCSQVIASNRVMIGLAFVQTILGVILASITVGSALDGKEERAGSSTSVLGPYGYDRPVCATGVAFLATGAFSVVAALYKGSNPSLIDQTRALLSASAVADVVPILAGGYLLARLVGTLLSSAGSARSGANDTGVAVLLGLLVAEGLVMIFVTLGVRNFVIVEELTETAGYEMYPSTLDSSKSQHNYVDVSLSSQNPANKNKREDTGYSSAYSSVTSTSDADDVEVFPDTPQSQAVTNPGGMIGTPPPLEIGYVTEHAGYEEVDLEAKRQTVEIPYGIQTRKETDDMTASIFRT